MTSELDVEPDPPPSGERDLSSEPRDEESVGAASGSLQGLLAMPTTVFKKQCPNSRLTVYLGTREFVVDGEEVCPIDGVAFADRLYLKDRRIFAMAILTFRYGREDEEVMGLKFFTEAVLDFKQVYPITDPIPDDTLSPLQRSLTRKLGSEAFPFTLNISRHSPPSVRLRPARPYNGSPLGVQYDIKVYVAEKNDDRPHKRSTVRLGVRCVEYESLSANPFPLPPPSAALSKTFVFSPGRLDVEAMLNKENYLHGDPLHVHVTINNNSNRTVHKVKICILQHVHVCMFTNGRFKNVVGLATTEEGHPIGPGASFSRDFCIKPMSFLKYPVALAVDTGFHDERNLLASSTYYGGSPVYKDKNPYGVIVFYEVKVKALLGCIDRPVVLRLPFRIMHQRPVSTSPDGFHDDSDECMSDKMVTVQT